MTESRFAVDRFDELRRAWIAGHQGLSLVQRRRAEQLGRRIRARQRAVASAVPDPHDDASIPPIWLRTAKSPAAQLELLAVTALSVAFPLGWFGGWVLKCIVVRHVTNGLRAYPIVALTWSGAFLGAVVVFCYDSDGNSTGALTSLWCCVQVASMPSVAGVLGVLDGWLAVPGSEQWWPMTRARDRLSAIDADEILGGYDTTGPGVLDVRLLNAVGERSSS